MSDIYSERKRSAVMACVRSKETKPEVTVRRFLFTKGFRYRKNVKSLPGTPDIVLKKYGVAIFINGCFWHGHTCKKASLPKTNYDFWKTKIDNNKIRDQRNLIELRNLGWRTIIIWECEIKNKNLSETRLNELVKEITLIS